MSYALGAGLPMLIIAYGSQFITTKVRSIAAYSVRIQQVFGVLILLLVIAMYFQYDTVIENKLTAFFPQSGLEQKLVSGNASTNNDTPSPLTPLPEGKENRNLMEKIAFTNYGSAPEFTGISNWLNSQPLTLKSLKGKVVLVDFWTYSCINCIRTLPYVTKWYDTYKDQGFVVIGVHTPEFAFEKVTSNVETAIKRFGINYPVAQDNDFATWNAYNNQYWPAEYLIDQNGQIVYEHFGEGNYDHTENAIRQLLGLNHPVTANDGNVPTGGLNKVGSPEMYFELPRLQNLTSEQKTSTETTYYSLPNNLNLNKFALEGNWKFDNEKAISGGEGKIRLHFKSGKVFMVAASQKEMIIKISVDGKPQSDVKIQMSQLYPLFDSDDYSEHTIDIEIPESGFEAFTFTFG
jgi:thiol-disulfide isomerase/thioredoxin